MKYKQILLFIVLSQCIFGQDDIYHGMLDQRLDAYYCGRPHRVVNAEGKLQTTCYNKAVYYSRFGSSFPDHIILPKGCLDKDARKEVEFTYPVPIGSRYYGVTYRGKAFFVGYKNGVAFIRFSGVKCVPNSFEDDVKEESSIGHSKL